MGQVSNPILLYDGLCHFCDASIQWILRNDKHGKIKFAPLQSSHAQELLKELKHAVEMESAVLIQDKLVYKKSKAIFKVMTLLDGLWPVLGYILFAIPSVFTDPIYTLVAKNRYKIAGRRAACRVPSPNQKERFILD